MGIVIITVVANCRRKCTSKSIMLSLEVELVKTEEDTKSRYVLRCHNITVIKIKIFTSKILAKKKPNKIFPRTKRIPTAVLNLHTRAAYDKSVSFIGKVTEIDQDRTFC